MKRFIYYLILIIAIGGSSAVVLFLPDFLPFGNVANVTGYDTLDAFVTSIINGNFEFKFDSPYLFVYGMALFLLINAAILLTMLLIFLFSGFNLRKVDKFYRICTWFIVSSILLTAAYGWYIYDVLLSINFSFGMLVDGTVPYYAYIPLAASLITMILAIIFRATERGRRR